MAAAVNPKVKYEEYMTHSKDDGVQRMRMQRVRAHQTFFAFAFFPLNPSPPLKFACWQMAENSADYYLEASKTYLTRMGQNSAYQFPDAFLKQRRCIESEDCGQGEDQRL